MYSSSLRQSSVWASIASSLTSTKALHLRETDFKTHHVTLIIPVSTKESTNHQPRSLHILLLDTSSFSSSQQQQTNTQLQHFASFDKDADHAIFFSFQNHRASTAGVASTEPQLSPLQAYIDLLAYIRADAQLLALPVVPLNKADDLVATLTAYRNAIAKRYLTTQPSQSKGSAARSVRNQTSASFGRNLNTKLTKRNYRAALDLLPYTTTASVPLSKEEVFKITREFVSMKHLAKVAVSEEARSRLKELLDSEKAEAVIDFWKEEWAAE